MALGATELRLVEEGRPANRVALRLRGPGQVRRAFPLELPFERDDRIRLGRGGRCGGDQAPGEGDSGSHHVPGTVRSQESGCALEDLDCAIGKSGENEHFKVKLVYLAVSEPSSPSATWTMSPSLEIGVNTPRRRRRRNPATLKA